MREIKFRAWDNYEKKMWYPRTIGEGFIKMSGLMQFTGMLDKNGVEIYEGDIVQLETGKNLTQTASVEWVEGAFLLRNKEGYHGYWGLNSKMIHACGYKVIGNIYEGALSEYANPDIIEQYDIQNDRSPQKGNKRGEQRAQGEQGNSSKDRAGQQKESRA